MAPNVTHMFAATGFEDLTGTRRSGVERCVLAADLFCRDGVEI